MSIEIWILKSTVWIFLVLQSSHFLIHLHLSVLYAGHQRGHLTFIFKLSTFTFQKKLYSFPLNRKCSPFFTASVNKVHADLPRVMKWTKTKLSQWCETKTAGWVCCLPPGRHIPLWKAALQDVTKGIHSVRKVCLDFHFLFLLSCKALTLTLKKNTQYKERFCHCICMKTLSQICCFCKKFSMTFKCVSHFQLFSLQIIYFLLER